MAKKLKRKNHTTRLSPLSFFPVSFRYETISDHTPTMLLTTSRRPGRERSPVSMALRRDCLDCIQSRCSAPFNLATMNSVIEKGSNVPNTTDAVFAGIASTISHRKPGNLQGSSCSHCQVTPCSTQRMCESLQQEKQVMPRCPLRSRSCPEMPAHCSHHHNTGQLWLLLPAQTPQPSTS